MVGVNSMTGLYNWPTTTAHAQIHDLRTFAMRCAEYANVEHRFTT